MESVRHISRTVPILDLSNSYTKTCEKNVCIYNNPRNISFYFSAQCRKLHFKIYVITERDIDTLINLSHKTNQFYIFIVTYTLKRNKLKLEVPKDSPTFKV
ncbi:hypothetical protein Hanom_Chr16g01481231 [Helianthus anomalus]